MNSFEFDTELPVFEDVTTAKLEDQIVYIGLKESKLYANDRLLCNTCSSFFVSHDFLMITTLEHTLRFLALNVDYDEFEFKEDSADFIGYNERIRRIENGAKILTQYDQSLVLIMPRGNLETIYPRALVLGHISKKIHGLEYKSAFDLIQKHRIDLNLIVDLDMVKFQSNIPTFISQLNPLDINIFLTSLRNENVTLTMYRFLYHDQEINVETKVNTICANLRLAMESDQEKYLECILTSQAKQSPQLLEEAMKIIYKKKESNPKDAEKAIKYLIFLADVNLLFNVALGIYDFPLVLMVAQHSQKDPREYLSFLEELNKHEINYRKFKIDNHLEKYPKALANLATAVAINGALMPEFIDFMKQHCLYRHAMFLFADKSKSHQVLVLYAEYLNSQNKFKDSGLVYELAGEFQKAANLYLEGLETKLYIGAVLKLDLTDENATQSYQQLCDKLIASSKYQDAAFVYTEYLKDDISAVKMLTRASMWQEALLKANNDIQIIDLEIKPHMINYCKNLVADLDNDIVSHEKNVADLESFRKKKKDMLASFADIEIMNDSASMATTVLTSISAFTARTGRTGKQRRKMERKRLAGKAQAFQDEYILTKVSKNVEKANKVQNEFKTLLPAVFQFDALLAKQLSQKLRELLKIYSNVSRIFIDQELNPTNDKLKPNYVPEPKISQVDWELDFLFE